MIETHELVPNFAAGDTAYFMNSPASILTVNTYCNCCNNFLPEVKYSIKLVGGVIHNVLEHKLTYEITGEYHNKD